MKHKHNCMTFPFKQKQQSICTVCRAENCNHITIRIGRSVDTSSRFILHIPADNKTYTGVEKRCKLGTMFFDINEVHGRIEDLLHIARHFRYVEEVSIRDSALPYILGVDACPGFKKLGKIRNSTLPYVIKTRVRNNLRGKSHI